MAKKKKVVDVTIAAEELLKSKGTDPNGWEKFHKAIDKAAKPAKKKLKD